MTAIDSLNSCCRLGQTTSFNSSTVEPRKPFGGEDLSSLKGVMGFWFSGGVELVTLCKDEVNNVSANKLDVYLID